MRCSRSMNVPRDCFSDIAAVDALLRRSVRKKRDVLITCEPFVGS
jgi:hypothetical protein